MWKRPYQADCEPEPRVSRDAEVRWEGDSKTVISRFPAEVKENLGFGLRLLQQGKEPPDYRPMPSVGKGVFELRDADAATWYRVVYVSRIEDVIYILHCFKKKGRKTPRADFQLARQRFKQLQARLREERKNAKRI